MFLFRKMIEKIGKKTEPGDDDAPIKIAGKSGREDEDLLGKPAGYGNAEERSPAEAIRVLKSLTRDGTVKDAATGSSEEKFAPVKVVIPARALSEGDSIEDNLNQGPTSGKLVVPDDIADSLLTPVKRSQPADSEQIEAAFTESTLEAIKGEPGKKTPAEGDGKDNLFSNLFGGTEIIEETPFDRLIKSLPDIPIEEVLKEAEEVKSLMNQWS